MPNQSARTHKAILDRAVGSVKWTVMAEVVSRAFPPLVTVILARLLTPEDYGVVGVAATVLSLSMALWDAGLGRALVQTTLDLKKAADIVLWSNLALSFLVFAGLFFLAPWLGNVYQDTRVTPVLRVLAITVVIGGLSTVQSAMLQRELQFRTLFWSRLCSSLVPGVVSIPMALAGGAHWALVGGTLAGNGVQAIILWKASAWRPQWRYDWAVAPSLLGFGGWSLCESLLAWFYAWGDSALLGAVFSVKELGVYRTGTSLVSVAFAAILSPVLPILYSTLCRFQSDREAFIETFKKIIKIVSAIALPTGVGVFLLAEKTVHLMFGDKWAGLGRVAAVFGLVQGYTWFISGVTYDGYRAWGRPDIFPKLMAFGLLYFVPVYLIAAPKGLETFAWTRLGLTFVSLPIHLILMKRLLGLGYATIWRLTAPQWAATGIMAVAVILAKTCLWPDNEGVWIGAISVLGSVLVGAAVYTGATWLLDRALFSQVTGLVRRAL